MTAIEYIQRQIAQVRFFATDVVQDLTDEQLNFPAPGTTNTIGAIYLHMTTSEDSFINSVIQGKPRIWDSEDWANKINISTPPARGDWSGVKDKSLAVASVVAYKTAVHAATAAFLATLTDDDLARQLSFRGNGETVADILTRFVTHTSFHTGEIAAIKGVHGLKGLSF